MKIYTFEAFQPSCVSNPIWSQHFLPMQDIITVCWPTLSASRTERVSGCGKRMGIYRNTIAGYFHNQTACEHIYVYIVHISYIIAMSDWTIFFILRLYMDHRGLKFEQRLYTQTMKERLHTTQSRRRWEPEGVYISTYICIHELSNRTSTCVHSRSL